MSMFFSPITWKNLREDLTESKTLNKREVANLIIMMINFQRRTGCEFKIEEYSRVVYILTDTDQLCNKDVIYFLNHNKNICSTILFTQNTKEDHMLGIYEDFSYETLMVDPYILSGRKLITIRAIASRANSVHFILGT